MLFGRRKRIVKRILIVEDEPLTAFDTETMLSDFGYEVVATLDDYSEAVGKLEREDVHLLIATSAFTARTSGSNSPKSPTAKAFRPCLQPAMSRRARNAARSAACVNPTPSASFARRSRGLDRYLQGEAIEPPKGLDLYITDIE